MPENSVDSLEPPPSPRRSLEDSGAHDLDSSDDHFSDAQSGRTSPLPITRVERIDDEPSYGEVPGTEAFNKRLEDAVPDEYITPSRRGSAISLSASRRGSAMSISTSRPSTPGGHPIPTTVVEKIDPASPSHGEVPGTDAYATRQADAAPDLVVKIPEQDGLSTGITRSRAGSTPGDLPIPTTRLERVDSTPSHGEVPGTEAYNMRREDAVPDVVREVGDAPGKHSHSTSSSRDLTRSGSPTLENNRSSSLDAKSAPIEASPEPETTDIIGADDVDKDDKEEDDEGFGDDFDDFEEGDEDAEFGDFDDGFPETEAIPTPPTQPIPTLAPSFPVLDFDELDSLEDIHKASQPYLYALFPPDEIDQSTLTPTTNDNPIFFTQRSASLWSQLVAPPPLQPPNWIRSRIRRLFLVSLGVPVDLDEILPASKQKKLILPSIHLAPSGVSPRTSTDSRSVARLKQSDGNASSTSVDSQGKSSKRRRGPPPPPELDLVSARQLCTITDEAMDGLTMEELQEHTKKLEAMKGLAKETLDYWTKRTDEKLGDREAFEGVIENLVKHARKVRK